MANIVGKFDFLASKNARKAIFEQKVLFCTQKMANSLGKSYFFQKVLFRWCEMVKIHFKSAVFDGVPSENTTCLNYIFSVCHFHGAVKTILGFVIVNCHNSFVEYFGKSNCVLKQTCLKYIHLVQLLSTTTNI